MLSGSISDLFYSVVYPGHRLITGKAEKGTSFGMEVSLTFSLHISCSQKQIITRLLLLLPAYPSLSVSLGEGARPSPKPSLLWFPGLQSRNWAETCAVEYLGFLVFLSFSGGT